MQEAEMTDNVSHVPASVEPLLVAVKVEPEEIANAPETQTLASVCPMETGVVAPPVQAAGSDATEKPEDDAAPVAVTVDIKPEIDLEIVRLVEDKPATEETSDGTKSDSTETVGSSAEGKERSDERKEISAETKERSAETEERSAETEERSAETRQAAVLGGTVDSGSNGRKTSAKDSANVAQGEIASSDGASETIKEEVDENTASVGEAVQSKASDVTKEGSLLRSRLQGVACQKSAVGQKRAEQNNQARSTKNTDNTLKQRASTAARLGLMRDVLGPELETGDLSSGSDSEAEKQEVVSRNVPPRAAAGLSRQPSNTSAQNSAVQNAGNVGQPGKPSVSGPAVYSCLACGMSFRFRSTLKFHMSREIKKLSYECKHCTQKMVFPNKCKLMEHVWNHGCDAIIPDMEVLASVTIPRLYRSLFGDSFSEDDDTDSEIEVCDFDAQQLATLFEGTAYVDLNSGSITVENESVLEKLENSASIASTDGGTVQKGTVPAGSAADPAAVGSRDPVETQPEDTAHCLVNIDSNSEPGVGSVNPAVSNSEAAVRSPTPLTSNSKCAIGISESAGNESDSLVGSPNHEPKRRPEDSTKKAEPPASRARLTSATSSFIVNLPSPSAQKALGNVSTHALVKHISSIGPVPSHLRSAPSPMRPVLSVRPFHSVKPMHSYKWVSSIATQASFQKRDTAVDTPGCVIGKPVVTVCTPAVSSPAVTVGTPTVTVGTPSNTVGTPSNTVGTPSNTVGTPSNTVGTPSITVGTQSITVGTPSITVGTPSITVGGRPSVTVGTSVVTSAVTVGTPAGGVGTLAVGTPVATAGTPVVTGSSPVFASGSPTVTVGNLTLTLDRPAVIAEKPPASSSYVGLRVKGFALEQNSNNIQNLGVINKAGNMGVICSECQNKMPCGELQSHFQTAAPAQTVETLLCTKCNLILPTACSLKAHKRIHSKHMPYVCPECGHVFTTFDMLTTHLQCVCFHLQKCVCYCCTYCKVLCKTAEELTEHILSHCHLIRCPLDDKETEVLETGTRDGVEYMSISSGKGKLQLVRVNRSEQISEHST